MKKIQKKPLKRYITTVRLNEHQKNLITASSVVNSVNQSVVISEAIDKYFGLQMKDKIETVKQWICRNEQGVSRFKILYESLADEKKRERKLIRQLKYIPNYER